MKKILLYLILLFTSVNVWSQVTIIDQKGWLESAYVKWTDAAGSDSYNVYYTGGGKMDVKIDEQLIRNYGGYFRADIPGLAAGNNYSITVKAVKANVESAGITSSTFTVLAQDRTGFAFSNGRIPGAYKADGTPKDNALILYITQNTKNTISANITGAANPCIGLQNILYGLKKGKETRPVIIRLIGNITDPTTLEGGDIVIENKNFISSYITFEGIGDDAVANGWGIRVKSASNVEIKNLGLMLTNASEGDNIGLQQSNDYIWVHNCDLFYGAAGSDDDQAKGDGAMDAKKSTYITFSYNHFWDSGKCNLLGLSENTTEGLYITYHHNWYDHSDSRHPRVRFYSAHVYNNYYDGNSKYGAGSTRGSSVFMESNFFRNCKYPMLTSMQGTDVFGGAEGTFSGESGGTIKAFNNTMSGQLRYQPYHPTNFPVEFDAIEVATRNETIPNTIKSKVESNIYNNFDTNSAIMYSYIADTPEAAKDKVMSYAGRVEGGDLKFTFTNADDTSSDVNTALMSALINYTSKMVNVQGEVPEVVNTQTLTSTSNNDQTVTEGAAISNIIFTWGGDATNASVSDLTELNNAGITAVINSGAKTVTFSGTPTTDISFSVSTSGPSGTPVTLTGTITVLPSGTVQGDQIHNFTTQDLANTFYTITGSTATNRGTATYEGLTLTKCLKLESSSGIVTFNTSQPSTLTLIMRVSTSNGTAFAKIDGQNYTDPSGKITVSLPAGPHKIEKSDTCNIFYIKTSYATLGTEDNVQAPKLTIYPNPATDQLYFSSSNQRIENVSIYSLTGALVKTESNVTESVDVSNLNTGSYLVKVTTDQGSFTQKILKK